MPRGVYNRKRAYKRREVAAETNGVESASVQTDAGDSLAISINVPTQGVTVTLPRIGVVRITPTGLTYSKRKTRKSAAESVEITWKFLAAFSSKMG